MWSAEYKEQAGFSSSSDEDFAAAALSVLNNEEEWRLSSAFIPPLVLVPDQSRPLGPAPSQLFPE